MGTPAGTGESLLSDNPSEAKAAELSMLDKRIRDK